MSDKLKTKHVIQSLERRHPTRGWKWLTFIEFRRIDLLAINCHKNHDFPRMGRIAYEVKVSRADFRKELTDPLKRADALDYSNKMSLAIPVGLLKPGELEADEPWGRGRLWIPPELGVVVVNEKGRTEEVKKAEMRHEATPLREIDYLQLLRRRLSPGKFQNALEEAALWKYHADRHEKKYERVKEELATAKDRIKELQEQLANNTKEKSDG